MRLTTYSFILLFILMTSVEARDYRAFCSGNRGKVSLSIYSQNERLFVRYNNALGALDFPIYEGVVTQQTMPVLKIAQEQLASLDYEVLVSWPIENCDFNQNDPLIMQCGGKAEFHYPQNSGLTSYTFITSRVTEESLTSKFEIFKIRWGIDSSDFHHSLAMPFDPRSCRAVMNK